MVVTARKEYAVGELKLIPLTSSLRVLAKQGEGKPTDFAVCFNGVRMILMQRIPSAVEQVKDAMIVPCWCVPTGTGETANVHRVVIEHDDKDVPSVL